MYFVNSTCIKTTLPDKLEHGLIQFMFSIQTHYQKSHWLHA